MTQFRGFYIESKEYCGYCAKSPYDKLKWWLYYPKAWTIFHWMEIKRWFHRCY